MYCTVQVTNVSWLLILVLSLYGTKTRKTRDDTQVTSYEYKFTTTRPFLPLQQQYLIFDSSFFTPRLHLLYFLSPSKLEISINKIFSSSPHTSYHFKDVCVSVCIRKKRKKIESWEVYTILSLYNGLGKRKKFRSEKRLNSIFFW